MLGGNAVLRVGRALEVAAADHLPRQQLGIERVLGAVDGAMPQRGDIAGGRGGGLADVGAGIAQGLRAPRIDHAVDVQVGLAHGLQAGGAQLGQAAVQLARNAAELHIAGVAQAEHGVLQLRQLGGALAGDELDQANGIVRRVAFALGADHNVEQALVGQLAGGIGIGAQQPYRQAGGLGLGGQLFGGAAGVAGLAAIDHGQPVLCRLVAGLAAGDDGKGRGRGSLRQPGGETGKPPQAVSVQTVHQTCQQDPAVFRQGAGGHGGGGSHFRSGLVWG